MKIKAAVEAGDDDQGDGLWSEFCGHYDVSFTLTLSLSFFCLLLFFSDLQGLLCDEPPLRSIVPDQELCHYNQQDHTYCQMRDTVDQL